MATSIEMYLAGLALAVNTFLIMVMYFISNVVVAPLLDVLGKFVKGPQVIPMWDMTYIIPAIYGILLIMEIIIIIAFAIVAGRRTVIDDYY